MASTKWSACVVGTQDTEVAIGIDNEPHPAVTEHGVSRGEHFGLHGSGRSEGVRDVVEEGLGEVSFFGGERLEEEVVVVGLGGIVEDGGLVGLAGGHDGNVKSGLVFEFRVTCSGMLGRKFGRGFGRRATGGEAVHVIDKHALVGGPVGVEGLRGEEALNSGLRILVDAGGGGKMD